MPGKYDYEAGLIKLEMEKLKEQRAAFEKWRAEEIKKINTAWLHLEEREAAFTKKFNEARAALEYQKQQLQKKKSPNTAAQNSTVQVGETQVSQTTLDQIIEEQLKKEVEKI